MNPNQDADHEEHWQPAALSIASELAMQPLVATARPASRSSTAAGVTYWLERAEQEL